LIECAAECAGTGTDKHEKNATDTEKQVMKQKEETA
jgi:hypothetical protein